MKDKIILFIIGVLVGAIISTGAFYVYITASNSNSSDNCQNVQMGGTPPSMIDGQNNNTNGEPPEKPDGAPGQDNNQANNN